eukprot:4891335-Amphidinium_carterae.1
MMSESNLHLFQGYGDPLAGVRGDCHFAMPFGLVAACVARTHFLSSNMLTHLLCPCCFTALRANDAWKRIES